MATVEALIHRTVADWQLGGQPGHRNKLAGSLAADATNVTFSYDLGRVAAGTRFAVGLETFYVWDTNVTSKTATVERGYEGTTAAAHDDGALVYVAPEWTPAQILAAFNDELDDLYAEGLFRVGATTINPNGYTTYELPAAVDDVLQVWQSSTSAQDAWTRPDWSVLRNLPTSEFASGIALQVPGSWVGDELRVIYRTRFTALTSLTQDVAATTGLPTSAIDLLPLGAALRLKYAEEAARSRHDTQGANRRAQEVPVGGKLRSAAGLAELRRRRINTEVQVLSRQYPQRTRGL